MKRLMKSVNATTDNEDKYMFTSTDVVDLLKHMEELKLKIMRVHRKSLSVTPHIR